MTRRIIPRDEVARELSISPGVLVRYEALGLIRVAHEGSEAGYEPAQIRRLWTIVTFQRDLGINIAGVEVVLRLLDRLAEVHRRVADLSEQLREVAGRDDSPSVPDSDE